MGIDWTYSGFTFRADCQGDIQVTMKAVNISNPSYMVAVLDGETLSAQDILDRRVKVTTKKAYTVLTDVPAGVHDIQLVKLTEAQLGLLDVYDLTINGQLMELPEDDRLKIEFIGDSITSGLGNLWNSSMDRQTNGLADQDGYHTYAAFTARALNADAHVVSLSGWGVAGGWADAAGGCCYRKRLWIPVLLSQSHQRTVGFFLLAARYRGDQFGHQRQGDSDAC